MKTCIDQPSNPLQGRRKEQLSHIIVITGKPSSVLGTGWFVFFLFFLGVNKSCALLQKLQHISCLQNFWILAKGSFEQTRDALSLIAVVQGKETLASPAHVPRQKRVAFLSSRNQLGESSQNRENSLLRYSDHGFTAVEKKK